MQAVYTEKEEEKIIVRRLVDLLNSVLRMATFARKSLYQELAAKLNLLLRERCDPKRAFNDARDRFDVVFCACIN
jgi:hypothetical protein